MREFIGFKESYRKTTDCLRCGQGCGTVRKRDEKAKEELEKGHGILIKEPYTPYIKAIEIVKGGGAE